MKGHLRERSPGHWGHRNRRARCANREAQTQVAFLCRDETTSTDRGRTLISELQGGTGVEAGRITVAQFLDQWLDYIEPQVAPRTHERYGEIVRTYLAPALGTTLLTKVQAMSISAAYNAFRRP
jgi:hypothetical protein